MPEMALGILPTGHIPARSVENGGARHIACVEGKGQLEAEMQLGLGFHQLWPRPKPKQLQRRSLRPKQLQHRSQRQTPRLGLWFQSQRSWLIVSGWTDF